MPPTLYILHAKDDLQYELALSNQLTVFEKIRKSIKVIRERDLVAGDNKTAAREQAIKDADIVVLLLTPAFWNVYDFALLALAERKRVIPVLVSSTPWTEAEFGGFGPLPSNERFIELWSTQAEAWVDVVGGLKRVWESVAALQEEQGKAAEQTAPSSAPGPETVEHLPLITLRDPLGPLEGNETIRVLFIAANPIGTTRLQLLEEIRQIRDRIDGAAYGQRIDLRIEPDLRINNLCSALLKHRPHIVHFSGHGEKAGAILLVDPDRPGETRAMDPRALRELFRILRDNIYCIVLNSCYSAAQASELADAVGVVIGMSTSIADSSAIAFSASFYEALAYGRSVHDAYELGRAGIRAMGSRGPDTPQLLCASNIDPARLWLIKAAA